MKVNTQAVNFNAKPQLLEFIQNKMNKLDHFYDKVIQTEVYLKVENTTNNLNKIFEAKINIPGESLMVKKQCKTFEEGVDTAISTLKRQLQKRKQKLRA
ncbi:MULTISPECIES: ribosome hibernation-promoting factor, HPF/YfiA family [Mesoflavibacter]|uniref:Ribosome-associated translation inhibitor RaiA n=1 Tax=Mesoflavibacter profundi TaxID=2708110 RepID=A0ABT4RZB8_9FLAO|nr:MULTISPECIES: ribosome-associated translation inhibitor RaiA [Mesoflavibacter]MDA0177158.1 ribosome-associated translation inhibitor RaiA [Mesoflavibacter profundi]QIJ88082.1 Ribosome hibernation promoting factor Hpf [Mesoflavibacter sp. HG96]QIJ90810.1 Ribosome hibernation promoting factor Hpf [Mesoflavibacter sp. HG37]